MLFYLEMMFQNDEKHKNTFYKFLSQSWENAKRNFTIPVSTHIPTYW